MSYAICKKQVIAIYGFVLMADGSFIYSGPANVAEVPYLEGFICNRKRWQEYPLSSAENRNFFATFLEHYISA